MKKIMITSSLLIAFMAVVFAAAGFYGNETPVSKEIDLSLNSSYDYSPAVYRSSKASVHVTIYKLCGNKQEVVADQEYEPMYLQSIPSSKNAVKKIVIPNVFNKKETLVATYTISYESEGSVLRHSDGRIVSDKTNHEQIEINI